MNPLYLAGFVLHVNYLIFIIIIIVGNMAKQILNLYFIQVKEATITIVKQQTRKFVVRLPLMVVCDDTLITLLTFAISKF